MNPTSRFLSAIVLSAALALGATSAAHAESDVDPVQAQVDAILAEVPGGTQTGPGEISWDGGQAVLTIAGDVRSRSVGSCPTGSFCAYTGSNLLGTRLAFTSCSGTNSLAPIGNAPRSFANARSSGIVYAYSPAGAVASAAPGGYTNVNTTVTRLGC